MINGPCIVTGHQKAVAAINAGKFDEEIMPVTISQVKGETTVVSRDENPCKDTTIEKLSKLIAVLKGVCTAGNSSNEYD